MHRAACHSFAVGCIVHLTRRLFLSEVQARLTLLLLAFYPNTIVYTSLLVSEILFTFLLLLVVALLLRTDDGLLAKIATGLVAACLCLVKPQAIVLPLLVMASAFVWPAGRRNARDMLSKLLIVYLCAGLLITLWTIRNVQVFDAVIFISNNGGVNLRIGNNPQADGTFADWTEEMKTTARKQAGEYKIDQAFRQAALEYIRQHPWRTLQLLPAKVYHLYRDEQTGIHWNHVELRPATSGVYTALHIFQVVTNIYYWLIGVLFLASIVFLIRRRQPFPLEGLAIIGYFTLLAMVFFGDSRYHFPLIPWLVMYASAPLAAGLASATPPPPAAETAHRDRVAPTT
jgi:hypothetical protein